MKFILRTRFLQFRAKFDKVPVTRADKAIVSEQIIELRLQEGPALLALADRILGMLPDAATEADRLRSEQFRQDIQHYRDQIRLNKPIEPIARKILEISEEYFKRAKLYRLEREHEYMELIEILREGVSRLAGGSNT